MKTSLGTTWCSVSSRRKNTWRISWKYKSLRWSFNCTDTEWYIDARLFILYLFIIEKFLKQVFFIPTISLSFIIIYNIFLSSATTAIPAVGAEKLNPPVVWGKVFWSWLLFESASISSPPMEFWFSTTGAVDCCCRENVIKAYLTTGSTTFTQGFRQWQRRIQNLRGGGGRGEGG